MHRALSFPSRGSHFRRKGSSALSGLSHSIDIAHVASQPWVFIIEGHFCSRTAINTLWSILLDLQSLVAQRASVTWTRQPWSCFQSFRMKVSYKTRILCMIKSPALLWFFFRDIKINSHNVHFNKGGYLIPSKSVFCWEIPINNMTYTRT